MTTATATTTTTTTTAPAVVVAAEEAAVSSASRRGGGGGVPSRRSRRRGTSSSAAFLLLAAAALLLLVSFLSPVAVVAAEAESESESESGSSSETKPPTPASAAPPTVDDPNPEKHWGTFYDPRDVFCGKYDCYKILGFDHETWGDSPPDGKLITRSYRGLSRRWHPDKNRGKGAKDRFVKINRAYEILTNDEKRKEYDYLRDRPDEYFKKYGSNVLYKYAPKSDTTFVVLILLAAGSAFAWMVQLQKWQNVADQLVKASVEGLGLKDGGTAESMDLRDRALEMLAEQKKKEEEENDEAEANGTASKKKKERLTNKEKKEREKDELRPIVARLVKEEMKDFGGGFHQPTWKDLLVVKMAKFPIAFAKTALWQAGYAFRRARGLPLTEGEREVLTRRAVGEVAWHAATEEDRTEMCTRDLWVTKNLEDWREWVEVRKLGPGYQKRYGRWKKKQGSKME